MRFKTNPETERAIAKLVLFFEGLPDGDEVSWLRLEDETGIKMDMHGKGLARRALKKIRRPYGAIWGVGIILSDPNNSLTIMSGKLTKVSGAVQRAARTHRDLSDRHLDQMSPEDRNMFLMQTSFVGALKAQSKASIKALPMPRQTPRIKEPPREGQAAPSEPPPPRPPRTVR